MTKTRIFFVALLAVMLAVCVAASWPPAPIQALPGVVADGFNGINDSTGNMTSASDMAKLHGTILGTVVASAATIAPVTGFFHVSGTAAIATITPPVLANGVTFSGCIQIVPDAIFTTTTGGNISLATTAVVNKVLLECYDGTKWNPSY